MTKLSFGGKVMLDFATAFGVEALGKPLSKSKLVRAIRFSVAAEYEAIQIYKQIAKASNDVDVKAVFSDVIAEERFHAGQFLDLLYVLAPDEKGIYEKAANENK